MINYVAISIFLCFLNSQGATEPRQKPPAKPPSPPISLAKAASDGLVSLTVKGSGGSSGDVILLRVKRANNRPIRLRVTPGMVLRSVSGAVQDMIVKELKGEQTDDTGMYRVISLIELSDDREHTYIVEAYCLNVEKDNPGADDEFTIDAVDTSALAVLNAIPRQSRSTKTLQAALWLAQGVTEDEITERFPVSVAEMAVARKALEAIQERRR